MTMQDIEKKYGFEITDYFRDFLETIAVKMMPEGSFNVDDIPWFWTSESEEGAENEQFYSDISRLFGVKAIEQELQSIEEGEGWNLFLLKHAYPIGKTYGGDLLVQVSRGKYKGEIYLTNHENWHDFFECIGNPDEDAREELEEECEDAMEELGMSSLENPTTEELILFMKHPSLDGNVFLAKDYKRFYATLCQYRPVRAKAED